MFLKNFRDQNKYNNLYIKILRLTYHDYYEYL